MWYTLLYCATVVARKHKLYLNRVFIQDVSTLFYHHESGANAINSQQGRPTRVANGILYTLHTLEMKPQLRAWNRN